MLETIKVETSYLFKHTGIHFFLYRSYEESYDMRFFKPWLSNWIKSITDLLLFYLDYGKLDSKLVLPSRKSHGAVSIEHCFVIICETCVNVTTRILGRYWLPFLLFRFLGFYGLISPLMNSFLEEHNFEMNEN